MADIPKQPHKTQKQGGCKKIILAAGSLAGIATICALVVASIQLGFDYLAATSQNETNERQIKLFQEQLRLQQEMATLQAGINPTSSDTEATAITEDILRLRKTQQALEQEASDFSDISENEKTVSWDFIDTIKGVDDSFPGEAWFCQAQTSSPTTDCYFGGRPRQKGCYIVLDVDWKNWISVSDAANRLSSDYCDPCVGSDIDTSIYGCGTPTSSDSWLLFEIR